MQTNYSQEMDQGFEGSLSDASHFDALSGLCEVNAMPMGLGVTFGTGENVKPLSAVADKFAGILMFKHVTGGVLKALDQVSYLRKGRILVKVEENVAKGDPVFVRAVATGLERAGAFRKSQDGTDCIDLSAKAVFLSNTSANGLAVLEINLP